MGKASLLFLGIIFDVLALACWIMAASQASVDYIGYGIVLFAVGVIIGSIGSATKSPTKND